MFGVVSEKIGKNSMEVPYVRDRQLTTWLLKMFPPLEGVKFTKVVNIQVVHKNTPLKENSEVALLPPFSGG